MPIANHTASSSTIG